MFEIEIIFAVSVGGISEDTLGGLLNSGASGRKMAIANVFAALVQMMHDKFGIKMRDPKEIVFGLEQSDRLIRMATDWNREISDDFILDVARLESVAERAGYETVSDYLRCTIDPDGCIKTPLPFPANMSSLAFHAAEVTGTFYYGADHLVIIDDCVETTLQDEVLENLKRNPARFAIINCCYI